MAETTKSDVAPPDFLHAALTEGDAVRLSSRKAACSSMAPPGSTGNPGSVYSHCETARADPDLLPYKIHPSFPCFCATVQRRIPASSIFTAFNGQEDRFGRSLPY